MTKYNAAIVGLTEMGGRALPSGPTHTAMGIEWSATHATHAVSHTSAFAVTPNVEVVAVCDLKEGLLEQFRSDYRAIWPEARTYTDYRRMLEEERVDLLGVATSDDRHAQIVVDAVESGVRGILCEKPLATTLADADRMVEACDRRGAVMSIDHFRRFRPLWNGALAELRSGDLGAVRRIVGSFGGPRAMLFRNGTHLIDTVSWFAGGAPEWVIGVLDEEHPEYGPRYAGDGGRGPDGDPGGSALVQFDNDVRAFINISKRTASDVEIEVFSERGRLRVNDRSAEVWRAPTDPQSQTFSHSVLPTPMTQRADTPALVADLIEAIEQGRETVSPPRAARRTLSIILAILQSQAAGNAKVRFPVDDA